MLLLYCLSVFDLCPKSWDPRSWVKWVPLRWYCLFTAARVYVCVCVNTDSVVERRALRETVFPRLREHCRNTHGLDLMVRLPIYNNFICASLANNKMWGRHINMWCRFVHACVCAHMPVCMIVYSCMWASACIWADLPPVFWSMNTLWRVFLCSVICVHAFLQVIDPCESSDPRRWPDQRTRQQLIYECQNNSNGPYLLVGYHTRMIYKISVPDQNVISIVWYRSHVTDQMLWIENPMLKYDTLVLNAWNEFDQQEL